MATYTYQQNYYDGASAGYVQYNITPDLGTPVAPGEKVVISGVFRSRDFAISTMAIRLKPQGSIQEYTVYQAVSAKKGAATAFSVVLEVPQAQDYFPDGRTVLMDLGFSLYHTGLSGDMLFPTTTQQILWLRYRINPEITLANFYRYGIDETTGLYERKNDGVYCMAAGFRIALAPGYTASDITVARITASVQRSIVQIPQSALAAALTTDGYVEQLGPSIFGGMTFSTDMAHVLYIEIGDEYDVAVGTAILPRSFANMCLCNFITGGVCFGGFPKSTLYNPLFENYYPAHFYGGIEGVNNYTAGEIDTGGRWIDGKKIYRYVFAGTTSLSGKQEAVTALPSSTGTMIALRCMVQANNGWRPVPNNYYANSNWNCDIYQDGANIMLGFGSSWSGSRSVIIIAEYTRAEE